MLFEEIEVDNNLLHLQNVLSDLDNYKFDEDIIKFINELKMLVNEKIYFPCIYKDKDIEEVKYKIIYYYEN